jgi:hypothetical protein
VRYTQTYHVDKEKDHAYKIKLEHWNGTVCEVQVNGQSAGLVAWKPYEADVTDLLRNGKNEVSVRVYGSLKNTFGFFYQKNDAWIFGPFFWNHAPDNPSPADGYFLMDYKLFEPFKLVQIK